MYLHNNNFKIIDATRAITVNNHLEDIWLDPTNYLKLIKNIKDGFLEIVQSYYLQNEIEENYVALRLEVSNISATLRRIGQDAEDNTLVIGNNRFLFLEKFGFNILSLDEEGEITDRVLAEVNSMIENKTLKYIFISQFEEANQTVQHIIKDTKVEILELHTLSSISEAERNNNENYISIMNENIEKLKQQLFD